MHRVLGALMAIAAVMPSAPVWAQGVPDAGWSLQWHAPAECPSERAVRAEVRSLLTGSTRNDVALSVTGDVLAVNQGYEVELRFSSKEGDAQRVLTSRDCKEVAKAAALVIALAIDPGVKIDPNRQSALEPTPEPPPAAPPPPPPVPKKIEPAPKPNASPARSSKPWTISIEGLAAVGTELGTLPQLPIGVQAGASLGIEAWRATLMGDWLPPRIYTADQGTRLRLSAVTASLSLGYAIAWGAHALTPELGVQLGNLSASARDADAPTSADSLLFGPQAGLRARVHAVGPLGFGLGLHGGLHLERPRLVVENRGLAHQPEPVWVAGSLGISLSWP